MIDLSNFDPNSAGNPNNNVFGLPFSEDDSRLVILPIPWEVTVSFGSGTARSAEQLMKASLQVDLFDPDMPDGWGRGGGGGGPGRGGGRGGGDRRGGAGRDGD